MEKPNAIIPLIVMLFGLTGIAIADPGIGPVQETHGISTSTTIIAVGHFSSHTTLSGDVSDTGSSTVFTYTEDTMSSGSGDIRYDKELTIDTAGTADGRSNIESTKQLSYAGINGGRVYSSDYIMFAGSGSDASRESGGSCIFDRGSAFTIPSYCNRAAAGSTIDMSMVNVRTTSDARFIVEDARYPVELNHDILVTEYMPGVPSRGSASAFMELLIREGRGEGASLMQQIQFDERTSVNGEVTLFEKLMHYESGLFR